MTAEILHPEEISRRIVTGMGLVYDLFQEVNSLLRLLAQGLANSEADIRPLTLRGSVLPRNKKSKSIVDWFLKLDVGLLATVGAGDSHESEETDDDNYQSRAGDPAVLTILATREGTSITVIDNVRDGFDAGRTWGQRLLFNQNGERASLTGQRKSDFLAESQGQQKTEGAAEKEADREGLNMVLLIQVPLKQKRPETFRMYSAGADTGMMYCCAMATPSDVEEAVIGHGKVEGPFTEIDGLDIERDERFPVRVTVQFYKATSNGVVSQRDMADIAAQIGKVYQEADYVGSLVVDGRTGRPTEYVGSRVESPDWWDTFWQRHFANTGQSRVEAMEMLRGLLGEDWARTTLARAEAAIRADSRKGPR